MSRTSSHRARAFTLVELLVVVGIIVVLISILLPALNRTRRSAQTVKCLANQRQLMSASLLYSNEYKDALPYTGWLSGPVPNWLYDNAKGFSGTQAETRGGQLWKYLRAYPIYRCPGDGGPWPAGHSTNLTSYVMNGAGSAFGNNGNAGLNILRFKPSDIMFWEIPMSTGAGGTYNDGTNYPNEGISARHKLGTTAGYIDGHAEVVPAEVFIRYCQTGPTPLWCDPTAADGGFSKIANKTNPIPVQE